jgi:uncharacterized membrane protein YkvA (DUF1232 family)
MTNQDPGQLSSYNKTPIGEVLLHLKLIYALINDRRVNPFLKLLPLAGIIYLIYPFDLIPMLLGVSAIDDIAVMWFFQYMFVELCPPNVVQEVRSTLIGVIKDTKTANEPEEIIDGEVKEIER